MKTCKRDLIRILLPILTLIISEAYLHARPAVEDRLRPLAPHSIAIGGRVGAGMDLCISNRIMVQDVEMILKYFLTRTNDTSGFAGEFLGKWLTAAALSCRYQDHPALQSKVDNALGRLLASRSPDGYLTTYEPGLEFRLWDVWIQKYVLLGLLSQYDLNHDVAALEAAKKSADYVLARNGPGKLSIEEYGPPNHKGGCNFSILEPMVLLYERTGDKRYLDFAKYIVDAWSKPGKYSPAGIRLIENALAGTPLVESEVLHSYAAMSCFEGLCELYRATGKKRFLDACLKFAANIERQELMIIGSVSNHEMWYSGALTQTEALERPVETCATATWIKLCHQLLRLTGDPKWADHMEVSLYNAMLASMMPHGEWWSYDSALMGERVPSRRQGCDLSCCVSSGPRGLLLTPQWAVMNDAHGGLVVNLYAPGEVSAKTPNGKGVLIRQTTSYPAEASVTLTVEPEEPSSFPLELRIPEWSRTTSLKVNGDMVECKPGTYARIDRKWQRGDIVTLELDLRGRIIRAPSGASQQAVMRGPIVLALDTRLTSPQDQTVWLLAQPLPYEDILSPYLLTLPGADPGQIKRQFPNGYVLQGHNFPKSGKPAYVDTAPVTNKPEDVWMAFKVPFFVRPAHFVGHRPKDLVMCDYASAGNQWSATNLFRVWLPQPMFMGNMYPSNTWKVMSGPQRTTVPDYIQKAVYR